MKASIKFREEQKPVLRAKIPINILSFPFQSGIVAGESKELSLNLSTFFESGPSFKFSYRPNDSHNPFSFIFKTGIGYFGSPNKSPLTMSAEFNLIGNQNPSFFIHFKPNLGDFSVKKSHSSRFVNGLGDKFNGAALPGENFLDNGYFKGNGATGMIKGALKGSEISAKTVLPVRDLAVVNFRWGLRVPWAEVSAEEVDGVIVGKKDDRAAYGIRLPQLMMNKIGIEHVVKDGAAKVEPGGKDGDVVGVCLDVKRQLELIQGENAVLRKALNDLRLDIAAGKMKIFPPLEGEENPDTRRRTEEPLPKLA
ncbi:uncharacterized protein LOC111399696 [Olea europaea var. sylvestris]|uniref:uncharacterized protein LOC111399696 n=1 Tax=Olea europaea var. sylvestris TaxID=158386 RepID=UPI000C1D0C2C|nr:uncharacterized protein LOC111399696 [Olea europaea var. sylvestris]